MANRNCADPPFRQETAIAKSGTQSVGIDISKLTPRGLAVLVPAVWTAADLYFEVSEDNETFYPLYDEEGSIVLISGIATSEARVYAAPATVWAVGSWPYMRLVASAAQGAARTLVVAMLG